MTKDIFFWTRDGEWGPLSNFWRQPIEIGGIVWPTSEHYYQAMKSEDPKEQEMIRNCKKPGNAKLAGYHVKMRKNWDEVKEDFMLKALRVKFSSYPYLTKLLLSTEDAALHEDSPWDKYWGYAHGEGKDRLGILLIQVREELRNEQTKSD